MARPDRRGGHALGRARAIAPPGSEAAGAGRRARLVRELRRVRARRRSGCATLEARGRGARARPGRARRPSAIPATSPAAEALLARARERARSPAVAVAALASGRTGSRPPATRWSPSRPRAPWSRSRAARYNPLVIVGASGCREDPPAARHRQRARRSGARARRLPQRPGVHRRADRRHRSRRGRHLARTLPTGRRLPPRRRAPDRRQGPHPGRAVPPLQRAARVRPADDLHVRGARSPSSRASSRRLRTRLEGGLVVELPAPDREVREAVARPGARIRRWAEPTPSWWSIFATRPADSVRVAARPRCTGSSMPPRRGSARRAWPSRARCWTASCPPGA